MTMIKTLRATIRQGQVHLLDSAELPEGAKVLVTLLPDEAHSDSQSADEQTADSDREFWLQASQSSLDAVWDNDKDSVYARLLEVRATSNSND